MSNFLTRLKESLDTGKQDDQLKSQMEETLANADKYGSGDFSALEKKAEAAVAKRKPLTPEEIAKINEEAAAHQKRIDEFDAKMKELAKLKLAEQDAQQKELEAKQEPFVLLNVVKKEVLNPPTEGVSELVLQDSTGKPITSDQLFDKYDYPKKEDTKLEESNDKLV